MRNHRSLRMTLFAAVCLAAATQSALAARMNFFDSCVLVPLAVYRSNGEFTAVGLTVRSAGVVYWSFYGGSGSPNGSGNFDVIGDTLEPFIWNDFARGFEDVEGSLLFCLDSNTDGRITSEDGDVIAANGFLVNLSQQDVAFLPTLNIDDDDLGESDPNRWSGNPATGSIDAAAPSGQFIDMQYLIDGRTNSGDDTRIYIWTSRQLDSRNQPARIHNGEGTDEQITIVMPGAFLNSIDLELGDALGSQFLGDGFVRWQIPQANGDTIHAFAFTIVTSPAFGAAQTLLGNF